MRVRGGGPNISECRVMRRRGYSECRRIVNARVRRADIVNAGSRRSRTRYSEFTGSRETRYSECGVQGD
ncbi:unnamed protein product [Staurois parvus]|uniref:Uncharacterized protein n=1 Tax=Staurois parvus TaxID=386267 RepID=A0ABN9CFI8_9NEOB|nr:unnamed protein product [Staurois parvus]